MRRSTGYFALIAASTAIVGILGCNQPDNRIVAAPEPHQIAAQSATGAKGLERAIEVQNSHAQGLLSIPGVVGAGSSLDADGAPVIVVLTERAGVAGIPRRLDGVAVVVEVTGRIVALQGNGKGKPGGGGGGGGGDGGGGDGGGGGETCANGDRTGRFARPVPIGVSTGHPDITAGTIGARVKNGAGQLFLLSNNHVFANSNSAVLGANVLQPGVYDGGVNPADAVGTLSDFEPLLYCVGTVCPDNRMDAAVAATTAALAGRSTPCDGYGIPAGTPVGATARLKVKKYGRTTGPTSGQISAVNVTVNVSYGPGLTARFTGQVYIQMGGFSAGGDSGSLIVTESGNKPVALLFAGSSNSTIGSPISAVLTRFGVSIDGT
jgi:hypothetical protein